MNKLLDRLRSERPLFGGAFGQIADELGFDRAVVRIAGFLILLVVPYLLGASFRAAWIFSILSYVALMIFVRRLDRFGSRLDRKLFRRWKDRDYGRFGGRTDCNGFPSSPQTDSVPHSGSETPSARGQPSAPIPVDSHSGSGQQITDALSDLEQRLARLDQRIQKMETAVTDRAFDWDRRFRKG
jgi:phage shock protein PspC (stress-responsive transcriptional regulator)